MRTMSIKRISYEISRLHGASKGEDFSWPVSLKKNLTIIQCPKGFKFNQNFGIFFIGGEKNVKEFAKVFSTIYEL